MIPTDKENDRRGLADQHRDRVFILRAQIAEIRVLRLCRLPLGFCLSDRLIGIEAGVAQIARQIQRFPVSATVASSTRFSSSCARSS